MKDVSRDYSSSVLLFNGALSWKFICFLVKSAQIFDKVPSSLDSNIKLLSDYHQMRKTLTSDFSYEGHTLISFSAISPKYTRKT